MDEELVKMRRYMLHHRIVTYAMVLFLVLLTFILISVSRQVQDEQALLLDSQARVNTQSQTQGTCTLGRPARTSYNGINSCYFGQYRSVSVRCNEGDQAKIIDASTLGKRNNSCASQTALQNAAYALCGCTIPGTAIPSTVVPTRLITQTGRQVPPIAIVTVAPVLCKKGVNTYIAGDACPTNENLFQNASYICFGGKKGTVGNTVDCHDSAYFFNLVKVACANESSCKFKQLPLPTSIKNPTSIPLPTSDPR